MFGVFLVLEMGSDDRDGNTLIKANFTADGAGRLKESVMEKLKEFMGDYTDDTLVVRTKIVHLLDCCCWNGFFFEGEV